MRRVASLLVALAVISALVPASASAQEVWVSSPFNQRISVMDTDGNVKHRIRNTNGPASMSLSPDKKSVAVVGFAKGTIDIYDADSRRRIKTFPVQAPWGNGEYIAYSQDGHYLWYIGFLGVEIYTVPGYKLHRVMGFPASADLQMTTDASRMYVMGTDGSVYSAQPNGSAGRITRPTAVGGIAVARDLLWIGDLFGTRVHKLTVPRGDRAGSVRTRFISPGARLVSNPSGTRLISLYQLFGGSIDNPVIDTVRNKLVRNIRTRKCPTSNGAFIDDAWVLVTCSNPWLVALNVDTGEKRWMRVPGGTTWDVLVR